MNKICLVIGGSHAAAQFVVSLRQGGWEGDIVLIGDELDLPYHRPPLSKDFMSGDKTIEDILIRPGSVYKTANIELHLGVHATHIDRTAKTVLTDKAGTFAYDKLVLATGARVRRLNIPGADRDNIFYLRSTKDVVPIKAAIAPDKKAVIIGGGYIGLETAASMRKQGMSVTVLEAMERILQRVTAPVMSDFYRRVHTEEGVVIAESQVASAIETHEQGMTVHTTSGDKFDADMVVIGIGVIPNMELADDAGLKTGDGIFVNEFCQTNDPDIYAIGDVTWHYNPIYDTHIRLESVPNATEQGKTAALHINGNEKPYNSLPWFWSDQFDLKLQIAGLFGGYDEIIVRGDPDNSRNVATFYFKGDRLLAVDAVNSPREFMMSKMALSKDKMLDKSILIDPNGDLKSAIID
ncbi:MAG: FAD-dependent oxidoreductase [Hellea sp.]|nr:FAD-dependent oxidoreductase [Hellea sp.]